MSTETAAPTAKTPKTPKICACKIGASGQNGVGSSMDNVDNPKVTCDKTTGKVFAQGHDAALSSRLATEVAEGLTTLEVAENLVKTAGGSMALVSKMKHSAKLRAEKKAAKAAASAPKADTQE